MHFPWRLLRVTKSRLATVKLSCLQHWQHQIQTLKPTAMPWTPQFVNTLSRHCKSSGACPRFSCHFRVLTSALCHSVTIHNAVIYRHLHDNVILSFPAQAFKHISTGTFSTCVAPFSLPCLAVQFVLSFCVLHFLVLFVRNS